MDESVPSIDNTAPPSGGLLRSRRLIAAARTREQMPSDGGSTGKTDSND
jgi:hypothetical protein